VGVHHQALPLADDADDGIAGDRPAALRQLHRDAFGATDEDGGRLAILRFALHWRLHAVAQLGQPPRDDGRQPHAQADLGEYLTLALGGNLTQETVPGRVVGIAALDSEVA